MGDKDEGCCSEGAKEDKEETQSNDDCCN